MTEEQEDVRDSMRRMYGLDFTFLETITMPGLDLHVFAVHGHENAVIAYGWALVKKDEVQYFSFLHIPVHE